MGNEDTGPGAEAWTVTGLEDSEMNLLVVSTMGTLSAWRMEDGRPYAPGPRDCGDLYGPDGFRVKQILVYGKL